MASFDLRGEKSRTGSNTKVGDKLGGPGTQRSRCEVLTG